MKPSPLQKLSGQARDLRKSLSQRIGGGLDAQRASSSPAPDAVLRGAATPRSAAGTAEGAAEASTPVAEGLLINFDALDLDGELSGALGEPSSTGTAAGGLRRLRCERERAQAQLASRERGGCGSWKAPLLRAHAAATSTQGGDALRAPTALNLCRCVSSGRVRFSAAPPECEAVEREPSRTRHPCVAHTHPPRLQAARPLAL